MTVLGYLRVSTSTQATDNQKGVILQYANQRKLFIDEWIEVEMSSRRHRGDRRIDELLDRLTAGDTLVVTELSRLGRSITEIIGTVNELISLGVRVVSIKEGIDLSGSHSMQSKTMIALFSLFAELERDLVSARTRESLAAKRAAGVKLGRPKGPGKSRLDPHADQIREFV